jgi:transcriptional regulator of acetoin/glycerol metabolism
MVMVTGPRTGSDSAAGAHVLVMDGERTRSWYLPRSGSVIVGRCASAQLRLHHSSVSREHARLEWDAGGVAIRDLESRNGTWVNGERVAKRRNLGDTDVVLVGDATLVFCASRVSSEAHDAPPVAPTRERRGPTGATTLRIGERSIVVAEEQMVELYALLEGETGVGKENAAYAVHMWSRRARRPFKTLNCAALQDSLLESELFGHEKGAFTGAVSAKSGLLEAARGGTVFLDEVGELSPAAQAKLLRAIESGRVTPVGAVTERELDVRLVAATNRDLRAEVRNGRFRQDLYFRLSGASVSIPPLRERRRELVLLAQTLLDDACERCGRSRMQLTAEAMRALVGYEWPGNVRELKNVMEFAAAALADDVVQPWHVHERLRPHRGGASGSSVSIGDEIRELETRRMTEALDATNGVRKDAAALIGMPLRTFTMKLGKYGLGKPR